MIPYLADEDFNGRIVRGLFLREPQIDLVRVQDVDLLGADDPQILNWAADNGRVLLTHDIRSMPRYVKSLVSNGQHVAGVFIVDDRARIGTCIDDLLLIAECSELGEWRDQVFYVPLK
ncbi:MAG: DUF5615 family PIN-like protein [Pirellulales bacterium]